MLNKEEIREIEQEIERLPKRSAACIEALVAVQRHRGWVSDAAIRDVAEYLGMDAAEVEGVATFYNLIYRRPVGERVILCCDSVSCWMLGGDEVRRSLEARLGIRTGETTRDGRYTLLPICCLGACERAPAMMVGEELHTNLDAARLGEILEE